MVAIILFASVPLSLLSVVVSWHNYQSASGYSAARASMLVTMLASRAQQDVAQSDLFLRDVAGLDELGDPAACGKALHLALVAEAPRYLSLTAVGAEGQPVCGAGRPPAGLAALSTMPPGVGGVSTSSDLRGVQSGTPIMVADLVARSVRYPRQSLVAEVLLGWNRESMFGRRGQAGIVARGLPMQAWLVGPSGQIAPLCVDCGWTLPAGFATMRAEAASSPGGPFAVDGGSAAQGALVGPVDVLVVTWPTAAEQQALSVFIFQVIVIVLLLGLGLVAVSLGANLVVVEPLQRLTAAVTQWRDAGGYAPEDIRLMPVEIRELSRAFTQATRSLAAHEATLGEAEIKQELLIKEIHHRVKNNLQIIASLLNLQANRIRVPEARAEFASARDRVRALATLHRYLYSEGDLQTLNMRSFLRELCAQLFQAIGEKAGHRIQLHIEAPEIAMATDQAVPMALIVTEAVSNAIKYAFPNGRSGHVHVSLSELGDGMGLLVIQDDGVGIPAGRAETETGVRDGLGIQLIRGFARQLGAVLAVQEGLASEEGETVGDGGTCYRLTFPLHPEQADTGAGDEHPDEPAAAEERAAASGPG